MPHDIYGADGADCAAVGIDHLSDEVLLDVLNRVLVHPRVLATHRALDARRVRLGLTAPTSVAEASKLSRGDHLGLKTPAEEEEASELWRRGLAHAGLPSVLLSHPPWSTSLQAEQMYRDMAAIHSYAAVCKRWRDLLAPEVKVAVCGVEDRPPRTVDSLIVAWDWNASRHWMCIKDDSLLSYLAELPQLRVLVLWDTGEAQLHPQSAHQAARRLRDRDWRLLQSDRTSVDHASGRAPPALPAHLTSLQHLVISAVTDSVLSNAESLLCSLGELPEHLSTLVHPRLQRAFRASFRALISNFPRLTNLDASADADKGLRPCDVTHLTNLRSLRAVAPLAVRTLASGHDDPEQAHFNASLDIVRSRAEDAVRDTPLAKLSALESLELTCGPHLNRVVDHDALTDLCVLTRLTHLSFESVSIPAAALYDIGAATALLSLRFKYCRLCGEAVLAPMSALSRLTSLHVLLGCSTRVSIADVTALTALADLRLAYFDRSPDPDPENGPLVLSTHTALTRLELECCHLSEHDCHMIASIPALRRLRWLRCSAAGAVCTVEALRSHLELEALTFAPADSRTYALLLRLPFWSRHAFPCLRECEVWCHGGLGTTEDIMEQVTRVETLRELRVFDGLMTSTALGKLGRLVELRKLDLVNVKGHPWKFQLPGLESLSSCPHLQGVSISSKTVNPAEVPQDLPGPIVWL